MKKTVKVIALMKLTPNENEILHGIIRKYRDRIDQNAANSVKVSTLTFEQKAEQEFCNEFLSEKPA